jgi:hypothetical protein
MFTGLQPDGPQSDPSEQKRLLAEEELREIIAMEKTEESVWIEQLVSLCKELPSGYQVKFTLAIPDEGTISGIEETLEDRLKLAGVEKQGGHYQLCVKTPVIGFHDDVGNTSQGRSALMSGENRMPFKLDAYSDIVLSTSQRLGLRSVLAINPTGLIVSGPPVQPYNLTATIIKNIELTAGQPLTPALLRNGETMAVEEIWPL